MNKELEGYINYLISQKKHPKATVDAYMNDLRTFREFICGLKCEYHSFGQVTLQNVSEFHQKLIADGKRKSSINHAMTSLRLFYDYLIIRGNTQTNPFREIDHFQIILKAPPTLNSDEADRLLGAPQREYQFLLETLNGKKPKQYGNFTFLRDQLIMELLYYAGLKVAELVNLFDSNVNCEDLTIYIPGKKNRNKSRTLQLPKSVIANFEGYILQRNGRWPNLSNEASPITFRNDWGGPITPRSINRMMKHYAQKAGLHPGISSETLRATFAINNILNGADANTIQYLLGFEELSTAESYVTRVRSELNKNNV